MRARAIRCVGVSVVGALFLSSCGSGDGEWPFGQSGGQPAGPGDSGQLAPIDHAVSSPVTTTGTLATAQVGPDGGILAIPPSDPSLGGVSVAVPAGALSADTDISVSGTVISAGSQLPGPEAIGLELIANAVRRPEQAVHPLAAPVIASQGVAAVTAIDLRPAGTQFSEPVEVSIPAALVGDHSADQLVAVMRSDRGGWEVIGTPEQHPDGSLTVEVDHFSVLGILAVTAALAAGTAVIGAACGYLCPEYFQGEGFDDAYAELQPLNHRKLLEMAQAMVCSEQTMSSRGDGVPESLWSVVDALYLGSPIAPSGNEAKLEAWIRGVALDLRNGNGRPNGLGQYELFRRSLELNGGNVFRALATVQNVLSLNRDDADFDATIQPYRLDTGDVRGARYHFWGMLTYSYIAEDRFGSGVINTVSDPFNNPEWAATFEEWWHNDIWTDPTEYAVDIVGAELGAEFYELANLSLAEIANRFDIDPNNCPELPMPTTTDPSAFVTTTTTGPVEYVVWRVTNYGSAEGGYLRARPADYDVDPPLLSSFDGGGIDPNLRAVLIRVDPGASFATEQEAVQSMCGRLSDFFRPTLASFILKASEGGTIVSVDDIFQAECG